MQARENPFAIDKKYNEPFIFSAFFRNTSPCYSRDNVWKVDVYAFLCCKKRSVTSGLLVEAAEEVKIREISSERSFSLNFISKVS